MKRLSFLFGLMICAALLTGISTTVKAQTASSGSVAGTVTDQQGAAVAGADVTLTDTSTKSAQTTTTNESGLYNFPVVHIGTYDLVITKSGFKVAKMAQQKVSLGLTLTLNAVLEVGALTETVVVTSAA